MAGAAARLIGRTRELMLLEAALSDAVAGLGQVVLLRGEAGIGKTHLAETVAATAEAAGMVVVRGPSWEEGGAPAWWPFVHLLRGAAAAAPLSPVRDALAAARDALAAARDDGERFAAFDLASTALADAGRTAPVLAILEDLHWADGGSLLLLKFLARHLKRARVLFVGTYRDVEVRVAAGPTGLLHDIAREGTAIDLAPLDEDHVRTLLVRSGAPAELASRVHGATRGNPFFVEEIARSLASRSAMGTPAALDDLPLSDGIRALVDRRLAAIPASTRAVVELAAAIGLEVDADIVRDAASRAGITDVDAGLRTAALHGVLLEVGGGRLRFVHDLTRQVVLAGTDDIRRAHRAIAAALDAHRADAAELARHLLACGDPRAAAVATEAGRAAMRRWAFDVAARMFERALDATTAAGRSDSAEAAELELLLGEALLRAGEVSRGSAACRAAAERARRIGDPAQLARAALAYGAVVRIGTVDRVHVELIQAALAVNQHDPVLRVTLEARLASAMQPSATPEQPLARARAAIAEARALGDPALLARVLDAARPAFRLVDDLDERTTIDRECVTLAASAGDDELDARARSRLAVDLLERGDRQASLDQLAEAERIGRARGLVPVLFTTASLRAGDAVLSGRFDAAERAIREALDHHARLPDPATLHPANPLVAMRLMLLRARARTGDGDELSGLDVGPTPMGDLVRAAIAIRLGRLDDARMGLARLTGADLLPRLGYLACALLPEIIAELDDAHTAEAFAPLLAVLRERIVVMGTAGVCEGAAARLVGLVEAARGRFDEAIGCFSRALAANQALGAAPFVHETQLAHAEVLLRRDRPGDRANAQRMLADAAAGFEQLGMTARLARVRARLRAPATPVGAAAGPSVLARLRCEGELWTVEHAACTARLRDAHGLRYLAYLLDRPDVDVHVTELAAHVRGEVPDSGDAGPVLDDHARTAYRDRVAELRETIEEAESFGDRGRAERARAELDAIREELARAVGLGGRDRRAASGVERLRVNITLRIRKAIERIATVCPEVADHLDRAVMTGSSCRYAPPPGPRVTT